MATLRTFLGSRRLLAFAVASAIVSVAAAVSLLAGAFTDSVSQAVGPTGCQGPTGPGFKDPLGGAGVTVSLKTATEALGRPIVLPEATPVSRADIGKVLLLRPHIGPTGVLGDTRTAVGVNFRRRGVWVIYQVYSGSPGDWDDVLLTYHIVHEAPSTQLIDLDGVPAVASRSAACSPGVSSVTFDAGGVLVTVFGYHDLATVESLARSIVDRSAEPPDGQLGRVDGIQLVNYLPPARQIELTDASAALGGRVVLPDTPLANAPAAGPVWAEGWCSAPRPPTGVAAYAAHPCWVWVSFPLTRVSIGYLRPAFVVHRRPQKVKQFARLARNYGDNAKVIELGHVLALAIEPRAPYPGSVEFELRGTRVIVAGGYDSARLREVAQSIVDRSKR